MSEEQFMRAFEEPTEIEYLDGRAVPKVSPKRRHGMVQGALFTILRRSSRGLGDVATEWRFHPQTGSQRTSLVPDVAFVTKSRLTMLSDDEREEPPFSPDIAIEVRSPSDNLSDVEWKMRTYLRTGSSLALDVVTDERIIRVFAPDGVTVFHENDRFRSTMFPWFAFDVREAFADLDS